MGWRIFATALAYGLYDLATTHAVGPLLFFSCCALTYAAIKPTRRLR